MNQFSIRSRLVGLVFVLVAILLWLAGMNLLRMKNGQETVRTLYEDRVVCLRQLKAVSDSFGVSIVSAARRENTGAITPAEASQALSDALGRASKEWKDYTGTALVPQEQALVDKAQPLLAAANAATARLKTALDAGDQAAAKAITESELHPAIDPLVEVTNQLAQVQLDVAQQLYADARAEYDTARVHTAVLSVLIIGAVAAFAWALVRSIVRPLQQAVEVAETVARGDLTVRVQAAGRDETAKLMSALQRMIANLGGIVAQVRASSDSIATGATQIAAGNVDLSQRTEEQASNLQQTAASMEQLTATVKQNADTAMAATQLAAGAASVASQGGAVVGQVVSTMEQINDASRRIEDIIGVIDGIAFQTNILALNAAVEAARAGEHGRGFSVVASEVRALAQRSAGAAREVKSLIGSSVERVQAGSALVATAGETMNEIVQQVTKVSDLIGEISAASIEQSSGIGQIGDAVQQLDQVTQQNAALVEEAAAAAESLRHQSLKLAEVVGTFRVNGSPGAAG